MELSSILFILFILFLKKCYINWTPHSSPFCQGRKVEPPIWASLLYFENVIKMYFTFLSNSFQILGVGLFFFLFQLSATNRSIKWKVTPGNSSYYLIPSLSVYGIMFSFYLISRDKESRKLNIMYQIQCFTNTSILIVGIVGTGSSKSEACCYAITAVDVKGKM